MALTGAVVGLLASVGVWIALSGWRGVEVVERPERVTVTRTVSTATLVRRTLIALALFGLLWVLTGWPMAGATAAGISLVVPGLAQAQRDRARQLARAEDLARWCEMLRDTMRAGNGLKASIDATAQPRVSGQTIRVPVRVLSDRCDMMPVAAALRLFADDVADPICDQIVTSLIMVEERGGKELVPVLSEIVESVRRRATMRRRVEVGRARTYSATRAMVVMTLLLACVMTMFATSFMEPFDTAAGQFWMGLVGVIFVGAVWSMIPMSRPEPQARLLSTLSEVPV